MNLDKTGNGTIQRKWRKTRFLETTVYTRPSYLMKRVKTRAANKRAKMARKRNR